MEVAAGLAEGHRGAAARLFWEAFGGKLGRILRPERKALAYIEQAIQPRYAISATEGGALLGVAGIKTPEGGFIAGGFGDMRAVYGLFGALWRAPLLELFARELAEGQMMFDGIFVAPEARGRGVGTALVAAVLEAAAARGFAQVRLEVIEGNARARALYERCGFVPVGEARTGLLAPLVGFRRATVMVAETGVVLTGVAPGRQV